MTFIYMTPLLSFHFLMYIKNYEIQIIKYKEFANIHEMQNVQCKICV